jgi:hypothetical protein
MVRPLSGGPPDGTFACWKSLAKRTIVWNSDLAVRVGMNETRMKRR